MRSYLGNAKRPGKAGLEGRIWGVHMKLSGGRDEPSSWPHPGQHARYQSPCCGWQARVPDGQCDLGTKAEKIALVFI